MKLYYETNLRSFEPWAGAIDRFEVLTNEDLDTLESVLEDAYPEGMSETELNDFFWFEEDTIADWLGFDSWEELEEDHTVE